MCFQESYELHPWYSAETSKNVYNDLAMIKLSSPFTLNKYVAAMALPASTTTFATGLSCTASGWGYAYAGKW